MTTEEIDELYAAIKEEAAMAEDSAKEGSTHMEALHYLRFCTMYLQLLDAKMDEVYDLLGKPMVAMTRGRMEQ